jgi:hypothetical protein
MRALLLATAAAAALASAFFCKSDIDCNLNGACNADGSCSCVSFWGGDDCGVVQFLPAKSELAGALIDPTNTSRWCAGILRDDEGF